MFKTFKGAYDEKVDSEVMSVALLWVYAEGVWRVTVTTSDVADAWTEGAQVCVVMCGDKYDSSLLPLKTDNGRQLRRGCTAQFTVPTSQFYQLPLL